ncbi:MAG TPA: hypothetical protein VK427_10555, partial [Kofleriaceae bacterium]|nr:hypothetical protein [Kofleriaceae bacterium]
GGDNVTTIILEAPPPEPTTTQLVRTHGAIAWWQKRQTFLLVAKDRGLTKNPIVRGLDPKDALDVVAVSLCQAVFHDLEKSTGVNVWTFAQNLASAWFDRGGEWSAVRNMMDILNTASRAVVDDVRKADANLGFLLDVAVSRALVVAELALGGLLAEQLRQVDTQLIQLHATRIAALEPHADEMLDTGDRFIERPTIPFLRPDRQVTSPGVTAEVLDGIAKTITIARARTSPRAELVKQVLGALDAIANEGSSSFGTAVLSARELYGVRSVDEQGIMPLFDALDQARILVVASVHQIQATEISRAKVLRALCVAHQRLVGAMTGLVLEAVAPYSDRVREITQLTSEMRDEVAAAERHRADLERRHATSIDPSLPWGARGNTEW